MNRIGPPLALALALGLFACRSRTNEVERIAIARWQGMVASVRDPGALTALRERARTGSRAGSIDAKRALGVALVGQSDASLHQEGLQWLGRAAEDGSTEAEFVLGKLELLGAPGVAVDYERAAAHLRAAAAQHEARASYYLALMARDGYGQKVDLQAAAQYLDEAARAGLPAAMFLLANAYREGKGVARDEKRAVDLYEAAAEKEHPASIQALAMAYRNGELGLAPDPAKYDSMLAELAHSHRHAPPQP
jgi:TPR repeat protein